MCNTNLIHYINKYKINLYYRNENYVFLFFQHFLLQMLSYGNKREKNGILDIILLNTIAIKHKKLVNFYSCNKK